MLLLIKTRRQDGAMRSRMPRRCRARAHGGARGAPLLIFRRCLPRRCAPIAVDTAHFSTFATTILILFLQLITAFRLMPFRFHAKKKKKKKKKKTRRRAILAGMPLILFSRYCRWPASCQIHIRHAADSCAGSAFQRHRLPWRPPMLSRRFSRAGFRQASCIDGADAAGYRRCAAAAFATFSPAADAAIFFDCAADATCYHAAFR
jgi:hypothetical protein